MNRKQAGAFAVGVLAVAIAIVVFGGVFDRSGAPGPQLASTGAGTPASDTGGKATAAPPKAPGDKDASAQGRDAATDSAKAGADLPSSSKTGPAASGSSNDTTVASNPPKAGITDDAGGTQPVDGGNTASGGPSFDLLRVEPDGSTVIAGRAQPGAKVDIMDKDKSLLSTKADNTGSFVAVFDKPLAPGNYQLTIKSTGKDKATKTSADVATVSVPKGDNPAGLLAMVSKPGEASRIITAPQAPAPVASGPGPAAVTNPPTGNDLASASQPTARPSPDAAGSAPQARAPVHVDAVEIEGDKVYVAGSAPRGSTVRVYADDKYVGEGKASADNRFVVNGTMALEPGNHSVRADLIDPKSGKVAMRATVPFDRPAGKDFAAVAPQVADGPGSIASSSSDGAADAHPAAPGGAGAGDVASAPSTSAGGAQSGPATVVQPALTNSDSFVIIRRGDTLWQISRRVYGRGVRYTTIYLANSQEITNPNLILPGQVFDVPGKPEKTIDQAVEMHRELMRKEGRR